MTCRFGCPLRSSEIWVEINESFSFRQGPQSDGQSVGRILNTKAETRRILISAAEGELTAAILNALRAHGRDGQWLKLADVAHLASIRVRTLQRKLSAENVTFSGLVEKVRFELATELLQNPDTTVADIAEQLGYLNQGDFTRAWKRWTGTTPHQARENQLKQSITVRVDRPSD